MIIQMLCHLFLFHGVTQRYGTKEIVCILRFADGKDYSR